MKKISHFTAALGAWAAIGLGACDRDSATRVGGTLTEAAASDVDVSRSTRPVEPKLEYVFLDRLSVIVYGNDGKDAAAVKDSANVLIHSLLTAELSSEERQDRLHKLKSLGAAGCSLDERHGGDVHTLGVPILQYYYTLIASQREISDKDLSDAVAELGRTCFEVELREHFSAEPNFIYGANKSFFEIKGRYAAAIALYHDRKGLEALSDAYSFRARLDTDDLQDAICPRSDVDITQLKISLWGQCLRRVRSGSSCAPNSYSC